MNAGLAVFDKPSFQIDKALLGRVESRIDRKLFSKIRTGRGCTSQTPTILALAIALELTLGEIDTLLERAGYVLSHASKFGVIVE